MREKTISSVGEPRLHDHVDNGNELLQNRPSRSTLTGSEQLVLAAVSHLHYMVSSHCHRAPSLFVPQQLLSPSLLICINFFGINVIIFGIIL